MPADMPAAQTAVLETVELLERVLFFLPLLDLLRVQAVCTRWKAIIDNSVKLQRCLFLKPAPEVVHTCQKCTASRLKQPELCHCLDHFVLNPLLQQRFYFAWHHDRGLDQTLYVSFKAEWLESLDSYEQASWKKMLVCQPHVRTYFNHKSVHCCFNYPIMPNMSLGHVVEIVRRMEEAERRQQNDIRGRLRPVARGQTSARMEELD